MVDRILVVHDEYDVSLNIKAVLEENGFKVDSFTVASQALENFRNGLYELVILETPRWMDLVYMRRLRNWMIRLQVSVFRQQQMMSITKYWKEELSQHP